MEEIITSGDDEHEADDEGESTEEVTSEAESANVETIESDVGRRDQAAEKERDALQAQLDERLRREKELEDELRTVRENRGIDERLLTRGVMDLEAGRVLARAEIERLRGDSDQSPDDIEELARRAVEKVVTARPYLFEPAGPGRSDRDLQVNGNAVYSGVMGRSARNGMGVKSRHRRASQAAEQAAVSGDRTDLMRYMRLRRRRRLGS